jgi:hypothetical protein
MTQTLEIEEGKGNQGKIKTFCIYLILLRSIISAQGQIYLKIKVEVLY